MEWSERIEIKSMSVVVDGSLQRLANVSTDAVGVQYQGNCHHFLIEY
jgi:hypothetical protein